MADMGYFTIINKLIIWHGYLKLAMLFDPFVLRP